MEIAKVSVNGVCARAVERRIIPMGIIGATVSFEYTDPMWNNLKKTVVFRGAVTRDVLDAGEKVTIPTETVSLPRVLLQVGIYGTDVNGALAIPTLWADIGLVRDAADPSGDESTDPELPIWAQLQAEVEALKQGGATDEQIAQAVSDYLEENPVEVTGVVKTINGVTPDESGNVEITIPDSSQNGVGVHVGATAPADTSLLWVDTDDNTEDENPVAEAIEAALKEAKESGEFDGKTPVRGTDYWSAADIAEIKSYVDTAILGGAW